MKIDIICSSPEHPINPWLGQWREKHQGEHDVNIVRNSRELGGGDILFLISCTEIVEEQLRANYEEALVLHASDLPRGRGWSPHIWEILQGAQEITVSLIDADEPVDSGAVWDKMSFPVPEHALHGEINDELFRIELMLMDRGLEMIRAGVQPEPQPTEGASHWPRRHPSDSEIDPSRSLESQFNMIRIADPARYPAFFRLHGYKYSIEIRKMSKDEPDND